MKVWDITQPTDDWERGYAHLAYMRAGLWLVMSKRIEVSYE